MERILAVLLSVSLVLTIINLTAFAMPFDEDCIRIVGFGELEAEVRDQKLKVGASESDIKLPDNLLVTVEKYKLLEKISTNELTETKEEKKKEKKLEGEAANVSEGAATTVEKKDAATQGMSSETGQGIEGGTAIEGAGTDASASASSENVDASENTATNENAGANASTGANENAGTNASTAANESAAANASAGVSTSTDADASTGASTSTDADASAATSASTAANENAGANENASVNENAAANESAATNESSGGNENAGANENAAPNENTDVNDNSDTNENVDAEPVSEDATHVDHENETAEETETSGQEEVPEETENSADAGNDSARVGSWVSDLFKPITVFAAEQDVLQEASEDQQEVSEDQQETSEEQQEISEDQQGVSEDQKDVSKDKQTEEGVEAGEEALDAESTTDSSQDGSKKKTEKKSDEETGAKTPLINLEEEEPEYETEYEDIVLYGVTWELDKENSSFDKFKSDEAGAKFVYKPVAPGSFTIVCDYPTITVTIEESLEKEISSAPFSQSCVVDGVYITVFADEGVFPVGARLLAESASDQTRESAEEAVDCQRGDNCNVVASYVFEIKIVDDNWVEIQPDTSKGSVKVAFSLDEVSNDNLDVEVYHIVEDDGASAQRLDASTEGDTVVAETEGFSAYSLQFTYNVKMYELATLPVKLSEVLSEVGLSGTPVSAPVPSNASLITVTADENNDYDIDCTDNFSSVESLRVELDDGNVYEVLLTQGYKMAGGGSVIYEKGFEQSAQDLVNVVLGNGVVAVNQQKSGTAYTFGNGGNDIGVPSGIILDTSGKKPNTTEDPDLKALCESMNVRYGGDTSVVEFEMEATGTELVFNYAFASDEFNQGPSFNDVFGLFISINGGAYENIALITRTDGTQVPVTIVNLRAGRDGTEMDHGKSTSLGPYIIHTLFREKNITLLQSVNGISNVFTAKANVNIGDTVKLKFAICDVGDKSHNSYVFIEAGSVCFNAPDGKNDYYDEEIDNLDPDSLFEITSGGTTYPVTSSSSGKIPMEGTDDNGESYSFIGETISIVKKGDATHQDSLPQTLTVAGRPDVIEPDTSEESREINTTDTSIVLTLDDTDPDIMRQQYKLFDGYGNPISGFDWVNAGDHGGVLSFSGLEPDTEYLVKIYIPATDNYPRSYISAGVRIRTDKEPLPPPEKKTEVVVHGSGDPISHGSVKKLDEYTQEQVGQKVLVRLNISPKDETSVSSAMVSFVEDDLETRYPSSSADHIFAEYMDMNVTRQIDDGPIEIIPDVERVIEIAVGYNLTNKLDPVVFREKGGNTTVLDRLQQRPQGNYQEGTVYIDSSSNTIYIYERYPATYAVGYYTYEEPKPVPPVKKTEVVVHGSGDPISHASVNKLDDYTQEQVGQKVLVRLNISPEDKASVNPATVSYVDNDLKRRYSSSSADHIFAEYMNMNVTRQIDDGPTENISDVERVIEIAVGYNLTNKLDPVVFRENGGNITVLDRLQQRPEGNYQEGTVYIDSSSNTIYIYERHPSTYAVGYYTYEAPPPVKNTEVVVHGSGDPVSYADVKNLDEYTQEQAGQKVTVRLNVSPKDKASVDPSTVSYVDNDLKERYSTSSADHIFAEYMDMNVTRQIDDGPTDNISDVERVIEIAVGYNLTNKLEPVVFREHDGNITVLDKLQQRPDENYQDGTVYIDSSTIYIYAQYFSTYAVGYHTYEEPAPEPAPTPDPPKPDPPKPDPPKPDPPKPDPPKPEPTPDPPKPSYDPEPQEPDVTYEEPAAPIVTRQPPVMEEPTPEPPVIKVVGRAPKTDNRYVEKKVWILLLIIELLLIGAIAATNIFICRMKKNNMQRRWFIALCRVGSLLIFVTVALVTQINFDYIKSQAMYKDIKYEYVTNQSVSEKAKHIADQYSPQHKEYWNKKDIDVAKMSEEYPDIVGWILFENEDISYPIMYSGDNYTYLESAYNGNWAYAGAIFMDGLSSPDFTDRNTLIYGHNMRDKSMFGKLKYYVQDPDYFEDHQYIQIHTANKVYRYQIFAAEIVGDDDDVYYTYGSDPEILDKTLIDLIQHSQLQKSVEPADLDHIVTLSTCTGAEDRRLIICASRVDEEDN